MSKKKLHLKNNDTKIKSNISIKKIQPTIFKTIIVLRIFIRIQELRNIVLNMGNTLIATDSKILFKIMKIFYYNNLTFIQ